MSCYSGRVVDVVYVFIVLLLEGMSMPAMMAMLEVQRASHLPQPKQAPTSEPRGIRPTQSTSQHHPDRNIIL